MGEFPTDMGSIPPRGECEVMWSLTCLVKREIHGFAHHILIDVQNRTDVCGLFEQKKCTKMLHWQDLTSWKCSELLRVVATKIVIWLILYIYCIYIYIFNIIDCFLNLQTGKRYLWRQAPPWGISNMRQRPSAFLRVTWILQLLGKWDGYEFRWPPDHRSDVKTDAFRWVTHHIQLQTITYTITIS
jgi:hypothetical protein